MGTFEKIYIDGDELPKDLDDSYMLTTFILRNQGMRSTWVVKKNDDGELYWERIGGPEPDIRYMSW